MDRMNHQSIRARSQVVKERQQNYLFKKVECPRCEGSGRLYQLPGEPVRKCMLCNGTGKV